MGGKPRKEPENIWAAVERKHTDLIKRFNAGEDPNYLGEPMSHWAEQAERLMAEMLLRATQVDTRSIVGRIASDRIMDMAVKELGSDRMEAVIAIRDQCIAGLGRIIGSFVPDPEK